jgi:hypothetical protein
MKKCSIPLTTREMQIKTTMKHTFISVGMAIIKNMEDTKCWQGWREKEGIVHC